LRSVRAGAALLAALPVAAAIALALAGAGSGAAPQVHLPRDHYGHPGAGIEWWYVSGLARGADGRRYSIFFALFSRAGLLLPVSQVVNLDTGALVGHSEAFVRGGVATSRLDLSLPGGSLRYRAATNTWQFGASGHRYALDLVARPEEPYVLHGGGTGVIEQSSAGSSSYYSATRMAGRGTLTSNGRRLAFRGSAWLDHQWGNFENDPLAFNWNWFSCRFDDETELMLYEFHTRTGVPLAAHRTGTFVLRSGRSRLVTGFDALPGRRVLAAAGRRWPLDWELRVPSERLRLSLSSIVRDQLVRGILLPTFWEGAATATGTKRGVCFVEQSYQ
jgi:predicted secreted hydrolase